MNVNYYLEWIIARDRRRNLRRQVEQERLVRLARAGRESSGRAGRRARGLKVRTLWYRWGRFLAPNGR